MMKALDCLQIMSNPKLIKCHQLHVLKTSQNIFPKMLSCDFHLIPTKRNRVRGPATGALPGRPVALRGGNYVFGGTALYALEICMLCLINCILRNYFILRAVITFCISFRAKICPVLLAAGAQVDARKWLGLSALKRWRHGAVGDFKVPKKIEFKM